MTGERQSDVDQTWGSRFPRVMIRHSAREGLPFSLYLMVDVDMVGRAVPTVGRVRLYSVCVIVVQVGRSFRP